MSTRTMVVPLKVALDPPLGPGAGVPAGETVEPGLTVDTRAVDGLQQNGSRPANTSTCLCFFFFLASALGAGEGDPVPWFRLTRGTAGVAAFVPFEPRFIRKNPRAATNTT